MIRTQIQLYDEQIKWLKKYSMMEGRSMSQVIRDSVDSYRRQIEKSLSLSLKKKNALLAVGSFSAGKKE
jgi:hypothetical protein